MKTAITIILGSLATLILSALPIQAAEISSGSGVVISTRGEILTNSHVVEKCENITVQFSVGNAETATLIARDERNDLAVVSVKTSPSSIAIFREGTPLRAGDTVVALGYPLSGLLATTANLSVGNVSALAGLRDDTRFVQISAPVQAGNSGGPLVDASGHLVGIVTSKLNAIRIAKFIGDVPQNVNFALKAEVVRTFLESKSIAYRQAPSDKQLSPADVGDIARPFTVNIECEQRKYASVANVALPDDRKGLPPAGDRAKPSVSPKQPVSTADELFEKGKAAHAAKKFAEAMHWFREAAEKGNKDAMHVMGAAYRIGQLVPRDYDEAMRWYRRAADKGSGAAMAAIGGMYGDGIGVGQNYSEGLRWLRKGVEKGDATAMYGMGAAYAGGRGVKQDHKEALRWFQQAAENGSSDGMYAIGRAYWRGDGGVSVDYAAAGRWLRQAADKGNHRAMNDIGLMHLNGLGIPQNLNQAMWWFRQAADKGSAIGMSNVGEMYAKGIGVSRDCQTARQWLEKSATAGYETARQHLQSGFDGRCWW
jgi:TPR repeat protein